MPGPPPTLAPPRASSPRTASPDPGRPRGAGTRKLLLRGLAIAGVVGLFAYVAIRGANRGNDFKYFYGAARLLWAGGHLRVDSQPRYPITLHVLLAPLASRSIASAAFVWAAISFAAVGSLPLAMARLTGVAPRRQILAWAAVGAFVVDALILGQSDPINLALVAWGLVAVKRGRGFRGAGLIGLAGAIKFLPAIHWLTALSRGQSRGVLAGVAASILGAFLVVALAVGPAEAIAGFREQAERIGGREKPWHLVARGGDLRPNNESLPIVLARTIGAMPDAYRPKAVPVLARWPLGVAWAAWGAVLAGLAVAWGVAARDAGRIEPGRALTGMFALSSVVMLAATPICWHHYFLWTLPACLFLIDRPRVVAWYAALGIVGSMSQTLRGLGWHMGLALGLFALVAWEIHRSATEGGRDAAGSRA